MIYSIVFTTHVFVSVVTLLAGFFTVVRSVFGWIMKKNYTRLDFVSSLVFTLALYMQLVLGFMVYILLRASLKAPVFEIPNSANDASLRFWAIEHIALMIFALFLTQLGRFYIKWSTASIKRFRASVFYYGTSLFLIIFSLVVALFFR
jgi:hypothetical protein